MRRVLVAAALVSLCLSGCATDKSFEKEILGHPAPESPSDTGWSRSSTPPPPAAPAPPPPGRPLPRPVAPPPVASVPPPAAGPAVPAEEPAAPKLFTPAPTAIPATPPASVKIPPKSVQPIRGAVTVLEGGTLFTFQVGEFAHAQSANALVATLKGHGYTAHVEQGKRNTKVFYKVFASKAGGRAALEGELLTLGVIEPRLTAEQPVAAAPTAPKAPASAPSAPVAPKKAPTPVPPAPAGQKTPAAVAPAPAATSRPVRTIAPPIVEPAPPLPDGYVPPPPKNGS